MEKQKAKERTEKKDGGEREREREREREEEEKEDGNEEKEEVFAAGLLPSRRVVMKARAQVLGFAPGTLDPLSCFVILFPVVLLLSLCFFFLFCFQPNKTVRDLIFFFNIQPNRT